MQTFSRNMATNSPANTKILQRTWQLTNCPNKHTKFSAERHKELALKQQGTLQTTGDPTREVIVHIQHSFVSCSLPLPTSDCVQLWFSGHYNPDRSAQQPTFAHQGGYFRVINMLCELDEPVIIYTIRIFFLITCIRVQACMLVTSK